MYLFDGEFYSIDMARFAKYMANRTFYGELSAKVVELNEALEEMIVAQARDLISPHRSKNWRGRFLSGSVF